MTQTWYAEAPAPARWSTWKVLVTAVAAIAGPPAGAVAGFVGLITWSGCFLSCTGSNHLGGGLLLALALGLLLSGPVLAAVLLRSGWAVLATLATPVVLLGLLHLG